MHSLPTEKQPEIMKRIGSKGVTVRCVCRSAVCHEASGVSQLGRLRTGFIRAHRHVLVSEISPYPLPQYHKLTAIGSGRVDPIGPHWPL